MLLAPRKNGLSPNQVGACLLPVNLQCNSSFMLGALASSSRQLGCGVCLLIGSRDPRCSLLRNHLGYRHLDCCI